MLAIWFVSGVFLGSYVIAQDLSIPLIIQPQAFCFFTAICFAQCLRYDKKMSKQVCIIVAVVACAIAAGCEVGFVYAAKYATDHGNDRVTEAWGILSAIFIIAGLLPQYYEVWRYKAVIGISLVFLFVDLMGGVFSTLSLLFTEEDFDILASISYASIVVLELGIFALVPILNPAHRRRMEAKRRADEEALAGEGQSLETENTMVHVGDMPSKPPQPTVLSPTRSHAHRGTEEEGIGLGWGEETITENLDPKSCKS